MATTHAALAAQLVDTDPTTILAGTRRVLRWQCMAGHEYSASGASRKLGRGCPVCSSNVLVPGVNDLATTYPHLAAQLVGTDPTTIMANTNRMLSWCCEKGHEWSTTGARRVKAVDCVYCTGVGGRVRILKGFNDLATTHPQWASELIGDDPTTVMAGTHRKLRWRCPIGHEYVCTGSNRLKGTGCGICLGTQLVPGTNDLATTHPHLAVQLLNVDPSTITAHSSGRFRWRCAYGHEFIKSTSQRTKGEGCTACSGRRVWAGYNDLATTHPHLAAQLVDDDPTTFIVGTRRRLRWRCELGHEWTATGASRLQGSGCPTCSPAGYDQSRPGWLYLLARQGEQQVGITGDIEHRLQIHRRGGWQELLDVQGPMNGETALDTETRIKRYLKKHVGTLPGSSESWSTANLEVRSLDELIALATQSGNKKRPVSPCHPRLRG